MFVIVFAGIKKKDRWGLESGFFPDRASASAECDRLNVLYEGKLDHWPEEVPPTYTRGFVFAAPPVITPVPRPRPSADAPSEIRASSAEAQKPAETETAFGLTSKPKKPKGRKRK